MIAASSFSDFNFKTEDIKAKSIVKAFPNMYFFFVFRLYSSFKTNNQNKISAKFSMMGLNLFRLKPDLKGIGMEASLGCIASGFSTLDEVKLQYRRIK